MKNIYILIGCLFFCLNSLKAQENSLIAEYPGDYNDTKSRTLCKKEKISGYKDLNNYCYKDKQSRGFYFIDFDEFAEFQEKNISKRISNHIFPTIKEDKPLRVITKGKNSKIVFASFDGYYNIDPKKSLVTETEKKTRLHSDFQSLKKIIEKLSGQDKKDSYGGFMKDKPSQYVSYIQNEDHSLIDVGFKFNVDASTNPLIHKQFRVGPEEHMYLTADMLLTKIKQLKYDDESNSLIEKEKLESFYLGMNYKIGDLYGNYNAFNINNISLKAMMKVSSKPLESFGFGVGYTIESIAFLKNIEFFTAYLLTTEDKDQFTFDRDGKVVFGISLNLSRGLDWISGG